MTNGKISRREIMRSMGVTGSVSLMSGTGIANEESNIERTITELERSDTKQYIGQAQRDNGVRILDNRLKKEGYRPDPSNAEVRRVDDPDKDSTINHSRYHVVMIPYLSGNDLAENEREETMLVWIDRSLDPLEVPPVLAHNIREADALSIQNSNSEPEVKTYTIEDGSVEVKERTAEPGSPATLSSSCYCEVSTLDCESVGMWCYIALATAYAGTYWSCAACIPDPTRITCAKCAAAVVGAGASSIDCINNADCENVRECLPREHIPDGEDDCEVCVNVRYPNCGM